MIHDDRYFIAVYGGSFDPPHLGHVEILKALCENPFCLHIILLPNYRNPLKSQTCFKADKRLAMCQILAQMCHEKIHTSPYEIEQNRPTHTIQSLRALQGKSPYPHLKMCFVLGSDSLATLHLWKEAQSLCEMIEFIVITRECKSQAHGVKPKHNITPRIREHISIPRYNSLSSSKVRELLHSGKIQDALTMIPAQLHSFIHAHFKL